MNKGPGLRPGPPNLPYRLSSVRSTLVPYLQRGKIIRHTRIRP